MNKYILKDKSRNCFVYERHNKLYDYDEAIEISINSTWDGHRGIQVTSYQKVCNTDGFNNAVGLWRDGLLRLPFMIVHFMIYRMFTRKKEVKK